MTICKYGRNREYSDYGIKLSRLFTSREQTGIFTIEKSNWENKYLYYYFSLKVFLLKEHLFKYFFFCKGIVNRTNYPLILNIIYSMDDCNNFTYEFINRLIYSENISILFLAIKRKNSFNISIINWIINIRWL